MENIRCMLKVWKKSESKKEERRLWVGVRGRRKCRGRLRIELQEGG